ncbi:MAG: hypothetical protein R3Y08_09080 [Rikenellaceae bacterium]
MEEDNNQPTSKATIIIAVIIAIVFIAALIWFATLNPGQSVLVMCVILMIYCGWRFLFG